MSMVSRGGWEFFLRKGTSGVGVVVVHEIFGLNPYTEEVVSKLSGAGHSAAAIDLFRGKKATTLEEGHALRQSLTKAQTDDGVAKGVELLREAGAKKVGAMGFCMGGGVALQAGCDLGLDFSIDYYGVIENEEDVSKLKGPVLVILGSDDERVTPWVFQKMLPAAMKHKKRVEVELYPNARHAFHRPGWEGHNPAAAQDAWDKTLRFLAQAGQQA